jgi:two-component system, chemotaxis family, response regulator PixG
MTTDTQINVDDLLIKKFIKQISDRKGTGALIFSSAEDSWSLHFINGRFVYATSNNNRTRRWYRALKKAEFSPIDSQFDSSSDESPWEYQILCHYLSQKQVSTQQAKTVIINSAQEIIFSLLCKPDANYRWESSRNKSNVPLIAWIVFENEILAPVVKVWNQNDNASLYNFVKPDMYSKHTELLNQLDKPDIKKFVENNFNGTHSFWDIAYNNKISIVDTIKKAYLLYKNGLIDFYSLEDLEPPIISSVIPERNIENSNICTKKIFKIACIDDSQAICKVLERILLKAGYDVVTINRPLEEMSNLVAYKPDLILLDLMMPDVDGYTLCTFLRKTPAFREIPIIILTSNSTVVDRTRAMSVGASGFLGKPPEEDLVLLTLKKHLPQ